MRGGRKRGEAINERRQNERGSRKREKIECGEQ